MVTDINAQPAPHGCAQTFYVRFRNGLLIAARSSKAMDVDERVFVEWPHGASSMLVVDVHFQRPVAGFQKLPVANISMDRSAWRTHGCGDDQLKKIGDGVVQIIHQMGVRVLAGDFGCALFALAQHIRGCGVQLHVAAVRAGTDNAGTAFADSGCVFLVGPVSKVKCNFPIGDTNLPVAVRSGNSLAMRHYIRGCGEPSDAESHPRARMDTLLKGSTHPWSGGSTQCWMPPTAEKTARTFILRGFTTVVPLMIFIGEHSRRKPVSKQRRYARRAERSAKARGKGKDKAKDKGKGKAKDKGKGKGEGRGVDSCDL